MTNLTNALKAYHDTFEHDLRRVEGLTVTAKYTDSANREYTQAFIEASEKYLAAEGLTWDGAEADTWPRYAHMAISNIQKDTYAALCIVSAALNGKTLKPAELEELRAHPSIVDEVFAAAEAHAKARLGNAPDESGPP
jgi:hypothetical protein